MKSRYSAYAKGEIDYIIRTNHPKNTRRSTRKELIDFSKTTSFLGLTIVAFEPGEPFATVTFHAQLEQQGQDVSFTEKSLFEKVDGRWLYLSGEIS